MIALFQQSCVKCHGKSGKAKGEVNLLKIRTATDLTADLERLQAIIEVLDAGEMPPEKKNEPQPLPAGEVETLRRWVEAGAPWPEGRTLDLFERTSESRGGRDWWSLQPVREVAVPADAAIAHPVDRFITSIPRRDNIIPRLVIRG